MKVRMLLALISSGITTLPAMAEDAPAPLFGTPLPERLWNEKVRSFGNDRGIRFGSSLTVISNSYTGEDRQGTGYDWDIYFDYKAYQSDAFRITLGAQFEDRDTWSGTDPNFNGFPSTSIFILDGNFYDHEPDLVEAWAQVANDDFELLVGRFDQGRRFAGFSYGGSFRYFFNQAFSGNSTLSLPFAQAFGADLTWHINSEWYAMIGVADANAVSQKMYNGNGDLFSYAELAYHPDNGYYHFYAWHDSGGERDREKGGTPVPTPESYGVGMSLERKIGNRTTLFSRLGLANKDGTAPSKSQVSVGFVYDTINPYSVGGGISWNEPTDVPLFNTIEPVNSAQYTAEIFARANLTDKINLSFGLTSLTNPFYVDESTDYVASARFQIWY